MATSNALAGSRILSGGAPVQCGVASRTPAARPARLGQPTIRRSVCSARATGDETSTKSTTTSGLDAVVKELEDALPEEKEPAPEPVVLSDGEKADLVNANKESLFFCVPETLNPGVPATVYVNRQKSWALENRGGLRITAGYNSWKIGNFEADLMPSDMPNWDGNEWYSASFTPPKEAKQMNFVLSSDHGREYDNNDGEDYLMIVEDPALRRPIPPEKVEALDAKARETWHVYHGHKLFFTEPSPLVPGEPGAVYMNRMRSLSGLANREDLVFYGGFNSWSTGNVQLDLQRVPGMPRHDDIDWWTAKFNVPEDAFEMSLAFSSSDQVIFDNNDDNDFNTTIASRVQREPRVIAGIESEQDLAGGKLQVIRLAPRPGASRREKWKVERMIRVWMPPGYHRDSIDPVKGMPVLYMNDGKNLFEDWLSHQGTSWRAADTAATLIHEGKLPPFLIVGIDSPGPFRSQCYLPFPPGCGVHNHREDAARWPGGDVQPYTDRIVHELMPMITDVFGGATDRRRLAFAGASFGGINSLYVAMHYPHVFGSVLAESPSLWSNMGGFLGMMEEHDWSGEKVDKLFVGVGTREFSYNKDHERCDPGRSAFLDEMDWTLKGYAEHAVHILESKGYHQHDGRLAFQVEEGAGHIETAWAHRLYGSLQYLCSHWWE